MSVKQPKSNKWCFTIFNFDDELIEYLTNGVDKSKIVNMVFQKEITPTTNKAHLQGHIIFTSRRYMNGVKKFLKSNDCHLEIMRGTPKQSAEYCTKDETHNEGDVRVSIGEIPLGQGYRSDLNEVVLKIKNGELQYLDIIDENPQLFCQYRNGLREICDSVNGKPRNFKSNVSVFYGASGTGKSKCAFEASDDIYVLRCNKNAVWFDGYNYNDTVVIDDFYGWIPFNMLLNMLDRYAMKVDVKGGAMEFNSKNIIITSNKSPLDWYPNLSVEHQIALLRRLDNVVYYGRNKTVDVSKALSLKIKELAESVDEDCEDELLNIHCTQCENNIEENENNVPSPSKDFGLWTSEPQGNTILSADPMNCVELDTNNTLNEVQHDAKGVAIKFVNRKCYDVINDDDDDVVPNDVSTDSEYGSVVSNDTLEHMENSISGIDLYNNLIERDAVDTPICIGEIPVGQGYRRDLKHKPLIPYKEEVILIADNYYLLDPYYYRLHCKSNTEPNIWREFSFKKDFKIWNRIKSNYVKTG